MLPDIIQFTGLALLPADLLSEERKRVYWPDGWTIHQFNTPYAISSNRDKFKVFVDDLTVGEWDHYTYYAGLSGCIVVMAFAESNDAVMFRMSDGETIWAEAG